METELLQTSSGSFWCFKNDKMARQTENLQITFPGISKQFIYLGDVCFDIGANIGTFSTLAARLVGVQGHIFAFEPCSETRKLLIDNLGLNQISDIVTVQADVVSDKACSHSIKMGAGNMGATKFQETTTAINDTFMSVTLDSWVEKQDKIQQLNFIKIDVEGMELKVLRGAIDLIEKYQPILYIEVCKYHYLKYGITVEELEELLKSLGYHFFRVFRPFPFRHYTLRRLFSLTQGSEFYDLLAIHPSSERYPDKNSKQYQAFGFMLGEKFDIFWDKLRTKYRLRTRLKNLIRG